MPKSLKESKYMPAILIGLAVLCVGGGIVFFITGSQNAVAYRRVLMNICGGLMVFLSLLLLYLLYLTRDAEPNFFLYDPQKRRNIQPDKLTFSIVNGRMNFFISQIVRDKNDLWLTDVLLQNNRFGYRGVYKPLVA
ncbi:MAG: hypothetical protein IJR83_05595, partial [Clostridia bacterium]|nr:hypothetical protein [Clostridia bacterium]